MLVVSLDDQVQMVLLDGEVDDLKRGLGVRALGKERAFDEPLEHLAAHRRHTARHAKRHVNGIALAMRRPRAVRHRPPLALLLPRPPSPDTRPTVGARPQIERHLPREDLLTSSPLADGLRISATSIHLNSGNVLRLKALASRTTTNLPGEEAMAPRHTDRGHP